MIRTLALLSALAVLSAPALAQDQKVPQWMMDEALPVGPRVPVENPNAVGTRPASRPNHMASSNQFHADTKPKVGTLQPMYGSRNSLQLERYTRPSANQPVKAPPRPR
ncbi:hypothetical protein [Azospirillum sp. TSO22-1]|uniref:hypothetical protein n=1 Tax=Azospirillum sp. TSO22-1 TaxID=716789 RepID=UPI000D61E16C|nr:hypothetical protein [Azospirillum sp. TSO22-1]PWC42363.1 hypothetical protein TSO221_22115 [Azospirillum sp. TSO22-1]